MRVHVCVRVRACVRMRVCVRVCECVHVCACVCVCVGVCEFVCVGGMVRAAKVKIALDSETTGSTYCCEHVSVSVCVPMCAYA